MHYVTKTKAGTTGKQTKINQDIAIAETKLLFGLKLFCVCDGHGLNGHLVSAFIKANLISNLSIK
jgi:serine/threonine protein phosphatase PrpC